jgi:anti-sigma factor RsiW
MTPHEDDRVDAVLRASRPEPDPGFTRRLERRLFGAAPARASRRSLLSLRPALAGAGAAGLLATAALIASLAGAGPLAGSDGGARAREDCRYVTVHRHGKVPVVVRTRDGGTRIAYRPGTITKRVKRCG